jgi:hypothetical protein
MLGRVKRDHKREFLAVYDYGMGGVWLKISARDRDEIVERFPQLTVYEHGERPEWMTATEEADYTKEMHFDVDTPDGWLAQLGASGE